MRLLNVKSMFSREETLNWMEGIEPISWLLSSAIPTNEDMLKTEEGIELES